MWDHFSASLRPPRATLGMPPLPPSPPPVRARAVDGAEKVGGAGGGGDEEGEDGEGGERGDVRGGAAQRGTPASDNVVRLKCKLVILIWDSHHVARMPCRDLQLFKETEGRHRSAQIKVKKMLFQGWQLLSITYMV